MASSAKSGFGTIIAYGDGASPEVFATIAETTNVELSGFEMGMLEATHNGSAGNTADYIISGVVQPGEATITVNYLTANATHIIQITHIFAPSAFRNYKLTAPSTSFLTFNAAVKKVGPFRYPSQGKVEMDITLQLSGKPSALMA